MTLRQIISALWRRRWLLLVVTVLALGAGVGVVAAQGPQYRAQSQVLLTQRETLLPGTDGLLTQQKLNLQAATFAHLVGAGTFVGDALAAAGVQAGDATVAGDNPLDAAIVDITVTSSSATRSVEVARAVQRHLLDVVGAASGGTTAATSFDASVIQQPSSSRSSISPAFTLIIALVAGFAVAATGALVLEGP